MTSQKLILSVLLSFSFLGLTACKKGGDKTSIKRSKGNINGSARNPVNPDKNKKENTAQAGGDADKTPQPQVPEDSKETGSGGRIAGDTNKDSGKEADPSKTIKTNKENIKEETACEVLTEDLKSQGWRTYSLQVAEDKADSKNTKKLKIVFYTLKDSFENMVNPVLYLRQNAFQQVEKNDLLNFSKINKDYKADPILMDMRGMGCSTAHPDIKTKTAELKHYGSRAVVADAEEIRKNLIGDKKWKVMAHTTGGATALRYAQLSPQGIDTLLIADFTPVKNQTELMKARLKQEQEVWKLFMEETKLSEEDIAAAVKSLASEKCEKIGSCAKLMDYFSGTRLSYRGFWKQNAEQIKKIGSGDLKAEKLLNILEAKKKFLDLETASRIMDLDRTQNLNACAEALKTDNKATVNSCRWEALLGHGEIAAVKNTIKSDVLDMAKIKANLEKEKIDYYLVAGRQSVLYPFEAYQEHVNEMGDLLENTFKDIDSVGSDVFQNAEFLENLK